MTSVATSYHVEKPFRLWLHLGTLPDGSIALRPDNVAKGELVHSYDGSFFLERGNDYLPVSLDPKCRAEGAADPGLAVLLSGQRLSERYPLLVVVDRRMAITARADVRRREIKVGSEVADGSPPSPEFSRLLTITSNFIALAAQRGLSVDVKTRDSGFDGGVRFELSFADRGRIVMRAGLANAVRVELPPDSRDVPGFNSAGHRSEANRVYLFQDREYDAAAGLIEGYLDQFLTPSAHPAP